MPTSDLTSDPLLEKAPLREGYKVLGGVVLYQKLGQGGMGAVYRGKHLRLEVDVALKVMATPAGLHPDQAANYLQRFLREAKTSASVKHQNLIRVYDVNSEGDVHFIIMDYIDGESAGDRLKRKGKLGEQEAVEICLGAAEGLAAAHESGVVHRDVKPDNILIDKKGNTVVADLGLAKAFGGESDSALSMGLSLTQQAMGTPYYMSPEQTRSAKDVGPQADVWSLGVTLYQLVTDKLPWQDTDIADLIHKIRSDPVPDAKVHCKGLSDGLCSVIEKALGKDADERYADCSEMARALRAHLDSIRQSSESILPDAEAGMTKLALVSVTPPPSRTLTLIGRTLLGPSGSERLAAQVSAETPPTARAEPRPGRRAGLPAWVVPAAVVGFLVLLAVILLAAFGGGGREPASRSVEADAIEEEAQQFLARVMAVAEEDRLEEATRLIDDAGTRYDATSAGPRIASLAETVARKLAAQRRQQEEERERVRREEEARRAAALQLIERGAALEEAGDLEGARDAYGRATSGASGESRTQAEGRLSGVQRKLATEQAVADIGRKVEAGEWRAAWDRLESTRGSGAADPRLDEFTRQVARALAPPAKLVGPLGVEFALVRGGAFQMGSDKGDDDERPVHTVRLTTFYVSQYEATVAAFDAFRAGLRGIPGTASASGRKPVVSVSWQDAASFCSYLSSIDPARPVYRLPREAEWESAARGQEGRRYPWGNGPPTNDRANLMIRRSGAGTLEAVGSHPSGATPEGVHDLVGNAAEWCLDWYGPYPRGPETDPTGPDTGTARVVRGGAYAFDESWASPTRRAYRRPDRPSEGLGFRVVRELTADERRFERLAADGD